MITKRKSNNENRVVISGIGLICSLGIGKDEVWDNLVNHKTGLTFVSEEIERQVVDKYYLHKIKEFDINNFGLNKEKLEELISWKEGVELTELYYLIASIKLALDDGLLKIGKDNNYGVVVSNENIGLGHYNSRVIDECYKLSQDKNSDMTRLEFLLKFFNMFSKEVYELQSFMPLYHICKMFNLNGYSLYINNACASGLYAIEAAKQAINSGKCNAVVVAASDQPSLFSYLWLKQNNLYAEDGKIKPFAENGDGFVLGEGGGAMIVENYEHAKNRGANIYCEYLGGGFFSENYKVMLPAVNNGHYSKVIQDSLDTAKISINEVDMLCSHGVGTNISDRYEADSINKIFKDKTLDLPIAAFKPYLGHNFGGSALIETILLLLCMENDYLPPILNLEKKHSKINLCVNSTGRKLKIKTALKTCCAFAGFDASAVFRKMRKF